MTYNVFGGTLSLTQSINHIMQICIFPHLTFRIVVTDALDRLVSQNTVMKWSKTSDCEVL